MQCRALPCGAVLCRAVPCFAVFSLSFIPDDNASKHTELARASMYIVHEHFIQHFILCCTGIKQQQYSSINSIQVCVRVCMLSLNCEHSKAQHGTARSPLHNAANQVRADQSTYQKRYARTCTLRPVCLPGACSSWRLQVACLHLTCWTTYLRHMSVIPIHSSL